MVHALCICILCVVHCEHGQQSEQHNVGFRTRSKALCLSSYIRYKTACFIFFDVVIRLEKEKSEKSSHSQWEVVKEN